VIRISEDPLERLADAEELPCREIGELIVQGPVVTRRYVTRTEANALHKMQDGDRFWHRMGDVGYLDEQDRFWFCGRKSHRVQTADGTLYTVPCEAIVDQHDRVYRSALVGIGPPGQHRPVFVVELWSDKRVTSVDDQRMLLDELKQLAQDHTLTHSVKDILIHPSLPVDIRHNAKIFREKLAVWADKQLG
jgi:acyl-CoA synthetase (AMP-forming)/AMP-acid ligase II